MSACIVYMTAGSADEAATIGKELVERRLAACVNILAPIRSLYHWDGAVQDDAEIPFIAKTTKERFPALAEAVRELHSYDTPCIVALDVADGDPGFLAWIAEQTAPELQ